MEEQLSQHVELLRKVSLFEELREREIRQIVPLLQKRSFSRGDVVVAAQGLDNSLFLVETGQCKVSLFDGDDKDKEVILAILKEGDYFGEMALLDEKPRSANVIALKKTQLYELKRDDFLRYAEAHPQTLINMLKQTFERLRKADSICRDLALLDVYGRVARRLLEIADKEGEDSDGGILIQPPSQQQLAGMLGTSRETVNRVISEFVRTGSIKKDGRKLLISNAAMLRAQVGD
ncbi:MAG: Crp/Fnr family transcriptional regulator [Deltaproteobacteria bacterium]|nr:Crp/Fnr family transcriptional regulator [Deltaproteobacteria bacterium]MBU52986.1 Crp/Fnr family transcriptional regulator [Deltaproteobacteria bacterium]|tara:strand:- start:2956 stop:3657 length:702 start_codon:yes stop_codon:yes gene_type:complete